VCEKAHIGFIKTESNASGIDITYDTETHVFTIGTQKTFSDLTTFNGKKRYERAASALKLLHEENTRVTIGWYDFALFVKMYCHQNLDPQCAKLSVFIDSFRTDSAKDKQHPTGINEIKMSIADGEKAFERFVTYRIANPNPGAGAAAAAPTCQDHVNGKGTPNRIIMTQYPSCIAYVNHTKMYEMQPLIGTKKKYSFKNFTIQLRNGGHVIVFKLELDFSNGANPISFTLELQLDKGTYAPEFVSCMSADELTCGIVTVTNVTMERSMLKVIGNVTSQKTRDGEMYDFQGFVTKFAEQYQFCTEGMGQRLENAEQLNRTDPRALAKEIDTKIITLDKRMPKNTQYVALKQLYSELKRKNPKQIGNLAVLNQINDGMNALLNPDVATSMGQLTLEPTGDDLAARLAALNDD
jgi:hypothetical protein